MLLSPTAAILKEVFLKEYYRERQSSLQILNVKFYAVSLKSTSENKIWNINILYSNVDFKLIM
jgi:hypothetical protein